MPHEVGVGEFRPCPLLAIVVQRGSAKLRVQRLAHRVARGIAAPQVEDRCLEWRDAVRPDDAGRIVAGLDHRTDQARHADAITAHLRMHVLAVRRGHRGVHRLGIFRTEMEDVADLDATPFPPARRIDLVPLRHVVLLVGRGVHRGHLAEERLEVLRVVVELRVHPVDVLEAGVVVHLTFAGRRQDDELVAEVAADRAALGLHRDRLQPHALEGAHIRQHHRAIAHHRAGVVHVERIRVLHQELAPAHHAEARPHLVAELPLDVVQDLRQFAVRVHRLAEQIGDHLLVGRTVQHVALVPVPDAQHLLAVVVVAPALAPQLGRLDRRHQHFLRAGRVLFLAHDALDVAQHAITERQPGIDAGRGLPHQAGAQHQSVRGDLRFGRRLLHGRDEAA